MSGPNLRKFQMRVAEIERDAAAGLIGNGTRRSLLIQARDQCGIGKGEFLTGMPGQRSKLVAQNDNQIDQMKNPSQPRRRGPLPA